MKTLDALMPWFFWIVGIVALSLYWIGLASFERVAVLVLLAILALTFDAVMTVKRRG
jgi:4-amino-4-deoxy-L-arabinose transferase-like glycosyltransferase